MNLNALSDALKCPNIRLKGGMMGARVRDGYMGVLTRSIPMFIMHFTLMLILNEAIDN